VVILAAVVLLMRSLRDTQWLQEFLTTYPGETAMPEGAPVGFPAWLNWQHFLNAFFIVLIATSGWRVRTVARPSAFWTRRNTGWLKTKNPPTKISLDLWFHLSVDALWFINGVIFYVLLFVSGQWMRIVPTSWEIFPNALSAGIQYVSLNWPTEHGWVNYNSLQVLSYFTIVFLAAPLAIITGLRMSGAWPKNTLRLNRVYPMELARAIHLPVMFFFVLFIFVHVTLVLSTGALQNLNHMYASNDSGSWWGFGIFALSLIVIIAGWLAAKPLLLRPIAGLFGKIGR
jgi:thiosulfate reductase cytochrome b subunit